MSSARSVAVVGAGSWGTALADLLARKGHAVTLWARDEALANRINESGRNDRYLGDHPLNETLTATADLRLAVNDARLIVSAVPSHAVRDVIGGVASDIDPRAIVVSTSKGIEMTTLKRMSEVLGDVLGPGLADRVTALSGPSFAREVCDGVPTAVTAAAHDEEAAEQISDAFATPRFRVYSSQDVVGVELGGAVKNIIAIATGIADGLGYGHNSRAALITRGLAEMSRLSEALGGTRLSLMGLAGVGDLVLTCTADLSRNRTVGVRIGKGETIEQILADMRMVAEGVRTTRSVRDLARANGVEMPITEQVYEMLYAAKSPRVVLEELMSRELRPEFERR